MTIDWKHPMICGNPMFMGMAWYGAMMNLLIEEFYK